LFCDCGCSYLPPKDRSNPKIRELINHMNAFRSYFESIGTNVIVTESFETNEWKTRNLDM